MISYHRHLTPWARSLNETSQKPLKQASLEADVAASINQLIRLLADKILISSLTRRTVYLTPQVTDTAQQHHHKKQILTGQEGRKGGPGTAEEIRRDLLLKDTGQGHAQGQVLIQGQGHIRSRMGKTEEEKDQVYKAMVVLLKT